MPGIKIPQKTAGYIIEQTDCSLDVDCLFMIHNRCINKCVQIIALLCSVAPLWLVLYHSNVSADTRLADKTKQWWHLQSTTPPPKVVHHRVRSSPGVRMNHGSVIIAACPWSGDPGSNKANCLMWEEAVGRQGRCKGYSVVLLRLKGSYLALENGELGGTSWPDSSTDTNSILCCCTPQLQVFFLLSWFFGSL